MPKILLVEDDSNLREIYQARLMAEGYEVLPAQNGEEAIVIAKQNKPDLIISDVMMPRISGFEMLDILRGNPDLKNTPVIMLTALSQAQEKERADSLGASKYLIKSQVTLEDIVTAAKTLLDEASGANVATAVATETTDTNIVAPTEPAVQVTETTPVPEPTPVNVPAVQSPVEAKSPEDILAAEEQDVQAQITSYSQILPDTTVANDDPELATAAEELLTAAPEPLPGSKPEPEPTPAVNDSELPPPPPPTNPNSFYDPNIHAL